MGKRSLKPNGKDGQDFSSESGGKNTYDVSFEWYYFRNCNCDCLPNVVVEDE